MYIYIKIVKIYNLERKLMMLLKTNWGHKLSLCLLLCLHHPTYLPFKRSPPIYTFSPTLSIWPTSLPDQPGLYSNLFNIASNCISYRGWSRDWQYSGRIPGSLLSEPKVIFQVRKWLKENIVNEWNKLTNEIRRHIWRVHKY